MPYFLFIAMCLIWGTSFILMRWASAWFNASAISAGRMLGGSLALFALWFFLRWLSKKPRPWTLTKNDMTGLGLVVIVGFIIPWTLQPFLIGTFKQSGFFGMMVSLVPLLTMLVSIPMLRTHPTPRQLIGVVFGLGMVALLVRDGVSARGVPLWAMGLAVLVPACYAVSNTFVKKRFHDADMLAFSALAMAIGLLFMLPTARGANESNPEVPLFSALVSLAFLGIVCSGLAMWMFYKMIQMRGPLFAGMVTYVVPGIAVLLGWAVAGESVTAAQLLALGGILLSVALVQWPTQQAAKSTAGGRGRGSAMPR